VFPENNKIHPGCSPTLLPETAAVPLLLTGEQSVRRLKVQSWPIARDSRWSARDGEILCE